MQQIRNLTFALLATVSTAIAADSTESARACFPLKVNMERLACYDKALGRSLDIEDLKTSGQPMAPVLSREGQEALSRAQRFLQGTRKVGEHLGMMLVNREDGSALPDDQLDKLVSDSKTLASLQESADLVVALSSSPQIGEDAVLTIACRSRITELHVYWSTPLEGYTLPVLFRVDEGKGEVITMRSGSAGYVLEAPRGLEAIRLVRSFVQGQTLQISVNRQAGNERPHVAFFEMRDLRTVLNLQGRMCSWSGVKG